MRENVRILGILHIVLGCIGVIGGLIFLTVAGLFGHLWNTMGPPDIGGSIITVIGAIFATFVLLLSVTGIIGGYGLLTFRPWARTFVIVLSIMNILNFPVGTALGIYGLVVLFNERTIPLFKRGGAEEPFVPYAPYRESVR
jgi:hypothetical protein